MGTDMTERVGRYLDGALEWRALTPEERAEADAVERTIREARAFMDARPAPDLMAGVMRQIEGLGLRPAKRPQNAWARLVGGLWTARQVSFQFRPAYGVLVAVVIMALAVFVPDAWRSSADGASSMVSATIAPKVFVQFRLQTSEASTVRLAGSFTNWQPAHELHQTAPGLWTVTLPLPLGVHDYAFIVNGERWVADPYAPAVQDGFGGSNSRLALVPPEDVHL
jgi:hypothetical protein